jgi:hypothetical protein
MGNGGPSEPMNTGSITGGTKHSLSGMTTWKSRPSLSGVFCRKLHPFSGVDNTCGCGFSKHGRGGVGTSRAVGDVDRINGTYRNATCPSHVAKVRRCCRRQPEKQAPQHVPLSLGAGAAGAYLRQLTRPTRGEGPADPAPDDAL